MMNPDAASGTVGHDHSEMAMAPAPPALSVERALSLLDDYLKLQASLAADDLGASKSALKAMMQVTGHQGELPDLIHAMLAADSLDAIRRPHFETLSNSLVAAVMDTPSSFPEGLLVMHCPMVYDDRGADWIQATEPLQNPYYGAMMLKCGEVKTKVGSLKGAEIEAATDTNSEELFVSLVSGYLKLKAALAADDLDASKVALKSMMQATGHEGELSIPAGVSYKFTGSYENQVRAEKRLRVVLPIALFAIWLILYFQFKRFATTMLVFSGIAFAWSGGFIMLWLYAQPWFFDLNIFGHNLRELFQMDVINLSVAVWVGFLALFGIATDDGVIMSTYLEQRFREAPPKNRDEIHQRVIEAASRRVRPALMTSATTILALLPVLTSTGRGSDIMLPMAIPSFGGMLLAILTIFVVPVLYCGLAEIAHRFTSPKK